MCTLLPTRVELLREWHNQIQTGLHYETIETDLRIDRPHWDHWVQRDWQEKMWMSLGAMVHTYSTYCATSENNYCITSHQEQWANTYIRFNYFPLTFHYVWRSFAPAKLTKTPSWPIKRRQNLQIWWFRCLSQIFDADVRFRCGMGYTAGTGVEVIL